MIEVTNQDGKKMLVNPRYITKIIEPHRENMRPKLYMDCGNIVHTQESYQTLKALIAGGDKK